MLHTFAIILYSRSITNQWHIYNRPCNRTPIIDYQEREKEKERQLTSKSNNQRTYNQVFSVTYDCTYKSTCFLCSKVKTITPTTSSFGSYCHTVYSRGIYTRWFYVHSLHPGQAQTTDYQRTSQAHYEALWTCTFGCVQSLLYTNLRRQSILHSIHWRRHEVHSRIAAPKQERRDLHLRLPVISGPGGFNGIRDQAIPVGQWTGRIRQ